MPANDHARHHKHGDDDGGHPKHGDNDGGHGPASPPVALTWTGAGGTTFLASDPANWSPSQAPHAGDVLTMHPVDINSGAMDVINDALAGTILNVTIDPAVPGNAAGISMDAASTVNLMINSFDGFLNTSGGTMKFIGTSTFDGRGQFFNSTALTGNGTLDLLTGASSGETMELGGPVGSDLTFNVGGGGPPSIDLRIDHPDTFQGLIDLATSAGGLDFIGFEGLQATSGDLKNGILQLFNGANLIDSTRINAGPGLGLELRTTSVGTFLTEASSVIAGTVIPFTQS
jgi:hypothetical protein